MREGGTLIRRLVRWTGLAVAALVALGLLGVGSFVVVVMLRAPIRSARSTTHASLTRRDCLQCHQPIAAEWRQSYHAQSLTGPYWKDVRDLGYARIFDRARKKCVNCHAPADVLDLADTGSSVAPDERPLGVECTPNLLREPAGKIPEARADDIELGVDCTSCHVSERGVVGRGVRPSTAHEDLADARFEDPATTSRRLCGTCHSASVAAWEETRFASEGITCLDCHMPKVDAASVDGGPVRTRRSHTFVADKDQSMLEHALDASLSTTPDRHAYLRIVNDRVGHLFPSGGNWVSVKMTASDDAGRVLAEKIGVFGKDEPLLLDFWPFNRDTRLHFGERREVVLALPDGHGTVEAVVRYHDWMKTRRTIGTFKASY